MKDITLFRVPESMYFVRVSKKEDVYSLDLSEYGGLLIDTNCDEKELRRIMDMIKGKKLTIAIVGGDNVFNRRVLDTINCQYLVSPERGDRRDNLKQRDSGLNHVLCNIAKRKGVSIVVDFTDVSSLFGKELALRLARIMQNIKLCRKSGCLIKIATFGNSKSELRSAKELAAFMFSLGASSQQARDSVIF